MMKKLHRKAVYLVLAVICLVNVPSMGVRAVETVSEENLGVEVMEASIGELPEGYFEELKNFRAVLSGCKITVDFSSDGMGITVYTGTSSTCPVVGVKDILVEQKVWYGWKTVAVSTGGEVSDTDGMAVYVTYTGAVKDETYRVSCIHYADLTYDGVENYTEGSNNTGSFVFTY